jgi:hypothetical protein
LRSPNISCRPTVAGRFCLSIISVALLLTFAAPALADTLTGSVKNATVGKPAAGDEVVLLNLAEGMQEAARTKTDAKGNFSFNLSDIGSPHLVRVIHQGVTYHRMAPPGTTSVEAQVYDVAKKVDGISVTADVMRVQAENNNLEIIRLFAINNASNPPKTQMNDQNFEFYLPEGAKVDQAMAKTAGGQPINSSAVPQKEKNRYAFIFPLRPGESQFQISYHLPYNGQATLDPKSLYAMDHFVVMLPKSMQFSGPASFQSMQDPQQSDSLVEVVSNAQPSQALAFKVSGTGVLPAREEGGNGGGGQGTMGGAQTAGRDSRPGGGLGPPIDAPDPLEKYRWYILGTFAVALAIGGYYIAQRSPAQVAKARSIDEDETTEIQRPTTRSPLSATKTSVPTPTSIPASDHSGMLLQALKEELFQLEVERQQGSITQQEYEKHKAALDQTLQRAVSRTAQKV